MLLFSIKKNDDSKISKFLKSLKEIFENDPVETTVLAHETTNKGVRFHINSKEPKAVEILLQRMFNSEFDIADDNLFKNN